MPEISQQQLDTLNRAQQLVDKLWTDKDQGASVRKKAKELFTDIRLPEDTVDPVVEPIREELKVEKAKFTALQETVDKMLKEKEDTKIAADFEGKVSAARAKFNLTDEGVQKMYAHMKETGNYTDVMGAAAYIVSQAPKPVPTSGPSWMPQSMNLFGSKERDEQWEKLHRDPQGYQDEQLKQFVSDPDGYVRETFGNAA